MYDLQRTLWFSLYRRIILEKEVKTRITPQEKGKKCEILALQPCLYIIAIDPTSVANCKLKYRQIIETLVYPLSNETAFVIFAYKF